MLITNLNVFAVAYDTNFELEQAKRFVGFSGVAYCTNPLFKQDSVEEWTCNACHQFAHVNATSFHGNLPDTNGFVAIDKG